MADTLVKKPVLFVGTKEQINAATMGENDFALVTDEEFYTSKQIDELLSKAGGASLPILTRMWSDHVINDMSWLRADTFSWQSGDVYKAAYEHLASELTEVQTMYGWENEKSTVVYTYSATPKAGDPVVDANGTQKDTVVSSTESVLTTTGSYSGTSQWDRYSSYDKQLDLAKTDTIGDITITYYLAQDGHKICLPDQESNLIALYEATGVAWYYILDTENKQFKLPRTKYGFTGLRDSVGGYVEAGLPNITGSVGYTIGATATATGAFTKDANSNSAWWSGSTNVARSSTFHLDASNSSSIYGKGDTVQPPATQMYLYFYVGNFEQSAIEQTAGLNTELFNGKADVDLNNINPSNSAKAMIVGWGMPDYSAAVSMSSGSSAPKNGWAIAHGLNATVTYSVNGVSVAQGSWASGSWSGNWNLQIMVSAGDVVTGGSWKFIPCKGVN